MPDRVDMMLELYPDLEELFEVLDITPAQVLEILIQGGHVELPDYVGYTTEEQETSDETET